MKKDTYSKCETINRMVVLSAAVVRVGQMFELEGRKNCGRVFDFFDGGGLFILFSFKVKNVHSL